MPDLTGQNWRVMHGDCRAAFLSLPAASVHCIVTSPPYWGGVRDYGIAPQIWGGELECDHEWESNGSRHRGGPQGQGGQRQNRANVEAQNAAQSIPLGSTCVRCGAWIGCYGNEPRVEQYVKHTLEIFAALGHALRDDGVIWWNIGDCYADVTKWGGRTGEKESIDRPCAVHGLRRRPRMEPAGWELRPLWRPGILQGLRERSRMGCQSTAIGDSFAR